MQKQERGHCGSRSFSLLFLPVLERSASHERRITSEEGCLLRVNRSIQAEGSFAIFRKSEHIILSSQGPLCFVYPFLEHIPKLSAPRLHRIFSAILRRFSLPGVSPPAENLLVWRKICGTIGARLISG